MYALLTAIDPALLRALRAFIQDIRGIDPSCPSRSLRNTIDSASRSLSVHIELATIYRTEEGLDLDGGDLPASKPSSGPHTTQLYRGPLVKSLSDIKMSPRYSQVKGREMIARDQERQEEFQRQI
ncbi:hypothetical protein B0H11DRAFT_2236483 [Mycena galericulata]|nr:hypothetical protein B0H11DRAFT_2236483 [Mycena galericulata]